MWADGVNDDEPILVVFGVETAKCLAPRELALAEKVGANDTLVEGAALGIVGSVGLVEGVSMSNQDRLNAAVAVGNGLNLERAVLRWMDAEEMLSPAGNGKKRVGASVLNVTRG